MKMVVYQYVTGFFKSNSYLLSFPESGVSWIVDTGDADHLHRWLDDNNSVLKGIFVTHSHFDHISGLKDILAIYPDVKVFCSENAVQGLLSSRVNRSYYTDQPFQLDGRDNVVVVGEGDRIPLVDIFYAEAFSTPGHFFDCITYRVGTYIFSGDTLIPGIKPFSKRYDLCEKELAIANEERVKTIWKEGYLLCPGHGQSYEYNKCDFSGFKSMCTSGTFNKL